MKNLRKIIVLVVCFILGVVVGYFAFKLVSSNSNEEKVIDKYEVVSKDKYELENELESLSKELDEINLRKTEIESRMAVLIEAIKKNADDRINEEVKKFEEIVVESQEKSTVDDAEEFENLVNNSLKEKEKYIEESKENEQSKEDNKESKAE